MHSVLRFWRHVLIFNQCHLSSAHNLKENSENSQCLHTSIIGKISIFARSPVTSFSYVNKRIFGKEIIDFWNVISAYFVFLQMAFKAQYSVSFGEE